MALYAIAVPAAFAIHPRANSGMIPSFPASVMASIFAPKNTNSQPYFSFWCSIHSLICAAEYLWLEFSYPSVMMTKSTFSAR